MADFQGTRRVFEAEMLVNASPETVWPQLCPVREYDWIEFWDCELIRADSGFNELDCVFRTQLPNEEEPEVWVTSRFEPAERLEFVRVNGLRSIRYIITLAPEGKGTRLTWTHVVTGLNEAGNRHVDGISEADLLARMDVVWGMLDHYLTTGTMLRLSEQG